MCQLTHLPPTTLTCMAWARRAAVGSNWCSKKPMRRPRIRVQVLSSPMRLASSSNAWTVPSLSREDCNSWLKSSATWFSSGRNLCIVAALVRAGVRAVRNVCHVSPCLGTNQENALSWRFNVQVTIVLGYYTVILNEGKISI